MSTNRRLKQPAIVLFALLLAVSSITMVTASGPTGTNVHDASFAKSAPTAPGWAVGDDGHGNAQILRQNTDGSWQVIKTFNGKALNSIAMVSANEGYAVGNGGFIVEYHGSSWQAVSSPTTQNLRRVKQGSTGFGNVIFAVGDNQTALYRGGDGGGGHPGKDGHGGGDSSWMVVHYTAGSTTLYGGAVVSNGNGGFVGYAVGAAGTILRFDSSSFTWTTITTTITDDLSDLNLSDPSNGFATTFSGKVVTYANPAWTLNTTLNMSNDGVLDLRHHKLGVTGAPNGGTRKRHAGPASPLDLTGADAVVVGNTITGTGTIGILTGGHWATTLITPNIQLNYLAVDYSGTIYAVGASGTIMPLR